MKAVFFFLKAPNIIKIYFHTSDYNNNPLLHKYWLLQLKKRKENIAWKIPAINMNLVNAECIIKWLA